MTSHRTTTIAIAGFALVGFGFAGGASSAAVTATSTTLRVELVRVSRLSPAPSGPEANVGPVARVRSSRRQFSRVASAPLGLLPNADPPSPVVTNHPGLLASFPGLDSVGSNARVPDQGLCVANDRVLELINGRLAVYDSSGAPLLPAADIKAFFGYPPEAILFDPSCLFDTATGRWFVLAALSEPPAKSALLVAVSTDADPQGSWNIYRIPGQSDGLEGTPVHPDCPCMQDYPHMAFDAWGLHISSSEKSLAAIDSPDINGPQIFSVSKRALAAGVASPTVVQIGSVVFPGTHAEVGFGLWPAVATSSDYWRAGRGSQLFVQSVMDYGELFPGVPREPSNAVGVAVVSNTRSLDSPAPALELRLVAIEAPPTLLPLSAPQKAGDFPLGQCLNDPVCAETVIDGGPFLEVEAPLANFGHVEAVHVRGELYAVLATAVEVAGSEQTGVLWLRIHPELAAGSLSASLVAHDYLAIAGNDLLYPTVAVGANGRGVVGFSISGPDHFPSFGFARSTKLGLHNVHLVAPGAGPLDDRSGYVALGADPAAPGARFGDYGAAAYDGTSFWIAGEYVSQVCTLAEYVADTSCGGKRHRLSNFATRIVRLDQP